MHQLTVCVIYLATDAKRDLQFTLCSSATTEANYRHPITIASSNGTHTRVTPWNCCERRDL